MTKKKPFILLTVLCLCVAIALCAVAAFQLPLRQRVDLEFQGVKLSSDGTVLRSEAIIISG